MSWKYFFDRDTSFHEYLDIPLSGRTKNAYDSKPVVDVAYGERPLEAVGQLFKLDFDDIFKLCKTSDTFMRILAFIFRNVSKKSFICTITFRPWYHTFDKSTCVYGHVAVVVIGNMEMDIWEAKDTITSILNKGGIPDVIGTAKYSLMFDYEHVEVDSMASCFAEIHRRNDIFNSIPLFIHRSNDTPFIAPTGEQDSVICNLTKLVIFTSQILANYCESKDYPDGVIVNVDRGYMLFEQVNAQCTRFIDDLENGPVHKMEKEVGKFMYLLAQLEKLIREKANPNDQINKLVEDCTKNLSSLFYLDLIPKRNTWIQVQNSCFILAEDHENWKKRVIWSLGEPLPDYYKYGELSEYSWVLNSESQERESYLMINGAKYYFGMAEIEEGGLRNKISLEKLKNAVRYQFQDKDKLCTSIACLCSWKKTRVWLCMHCHWLIRDYGGTGVVCRCRRSALKNMIVYCNGCKINETGVGREAINDKEIKVYGKQKILDDIAKNRDGNQNHNGKGGNKTPGQPTKGNQKPTFDNSSNPLSSSVKLKSILESLSKLVPGPSRYLPTQALTKQAPEPPPKPKPEPGPITPASEPLPKPLPPPPAVTKEWDRNITAYNEHQTIPVPQEYTIIFMGESGVGKSTLINGLANYLNWPTFEEAKKNTMQIRIPVKFTVRKGKPDGQIEEATVKAGIMQENENFNDDGQSVTQEPRIHQFIFRRDIVKVIDTPGLSDSRGIEQDMINLELISKCIHEQKVHALCIFLKSHENKLEEELEQSICRLFSQFPKSALKNVFFFFTYAKETSFKIRDALTPLKKLQKKVKGSHRVTYELQGNNMYRVDSESFRYLLSKENGIFYSNIPEKDFEFSWNKTASQLQNFLTWIRFVKPISKKSIINIHKLKSSFSDILIRRRLERGDERVISAGMDRLRFMIMKHSLVFPPYCPLVKNVTKEEFFTHLDAMIPIIQRYKPRAVEKVQKLKEIIYFER